MEIKNFTGDVKQKTFSKESFCSAECFEEAYNHLIFLSVLHICLFISAFLGNSLILVALRKTSSLHPPSKLLYRSLATTDLCTGIIVDPLVVTRFIGVMNKQWNICRYAYDAITITGYILCSLSFLTMTAISVDRLLALLLGLRYREVVTLRRTYVSVIVFWAVSIVGTTMYFWNPSITSWTARIFLWLCLFTSGFSYTKIFLTLRHNSHNQVQIQNHISQGQPSHAIPLSMARYRKAVSSALWVQVTLVACYLPFSVASAFSAQRELSLSVFLARIL